MLLRSHRNAFDALARDVVEVRRTAADHRAQGDDAVETPRCGHLANGNRHLEGARNADDLNVGVVRTVLTKTVNRPLYERLHDELIEA